MGFDYHWKNKEANFGPPLEKEVKGGTHITFEIILKSGEKYVALRRSNAIPGHELPPKAKDKPEGLLYFCHNLIRYGESIENCVKRIVRDQAGINVESFELVDLESEVQEKDSQWAITVYIIAEVDKIPEKSPEVPEIVTFDKESIPDEFGWWTKEELKEFLEEKD